MRSPLDQLTPGQISRSAIVVAIATAIALGCGYVSNALTPTTAALGAFVLASSLLLAAPTQRASEMLGAVTVWMCFAEFLSTTQSGQFAMWRLAVTVATLGGVIGVIRIQHLRNLARHTPDTSLADLDRRTLGGIGVVPRSTAKLAAMRHETAPDALPEKG
ncbi:hypothetical protein GGQ88_002011 [Novosphingobium hassiacum]|uniref:Uncharacterized protein n=1 Tax=Novosphingobium hassiacum TaxID=173676 RepID=A0A7W5ZWN9_9SPHN|nr:hypothetical protein [Novosphingobium hassiacum]MBB3860742.1 hypothetical protein [Novosphingobium hassiacum]